MAGSFPPLTIYDKNGVRMVFNFNKNANAPDVAAMQLVATNSSAAHIGQFVFQVAVPKVRSLHKSTAHTAVVVQFLMAIHVTYLISPPPLAQTLKMQVGPASGTDILPLNANRLTQVIKIANPTQVCRTQPFKIRLIFFFCTTSVFVVSKTKDARSGV